MAATQPCRFAEDADHVCLAYDGGPVRPHGICYAEARSQVREQRVEQGLPEEPSQAVIDRVAEIVRTAQATRRAG